MIVIAPTSELAPDQVARYVHSLSLDVTLKETCYGLNVEGPSGNVHKAVEAVRQLDPNRVFSKVRAFPIGDERRCRAHHGSRPGFPQVEKEWKDLALIDAGLQAAEAGERPAEKGRPQPLPVERLKEIIREVLD